VRINCQEDFSILLEEMEGKKAIKIFVRDADQKPEPVPQEVTEEVTETKPVEVDTEKMDVEQTKETKDSDSSDVTSSDEDCKKWKKKGKWMKKRKWMKKKFQKNLDRSIQKAIPEIAQEVAKILGKRPTDHAEIPQNDKEPQMFTGEFNGQDIHKMFKHGKKMFHEMMGGKKMWHKKKHMMK